MNDLKPAPSLTSTQLEEIVQAIVDTFDERELSRVLRFKWGLVLPNYVNTKQGFFGIVSDFVEWTERRHKTLELLQLTYTERIDHPAVVRLANALGLSRPRNALQIEKPENLQALVARHSRFVDYNRYLERLQSIGGRICRVETPTTMGTGFLVGPDLVLTNYHVVCSPDEDPSAAKGNVITCRFDHRSDNDAGPGERKAKKAVPSAFGLSEQWLAAKSPFSESDITGEGEPQADECDYALLRLAEKVGDQKTSDGNVRGWFNVASDRPVLALGDFVVIPQHAEGRTLEMAWGSVLSFTTHGTRARYDTSTSKGSSGSPCLTVDLDIFGLHHATAPTKKPSFNQAIPLDYIGRDLATRNAFRI